MKNYICMSCGEDIVNKDEGMLEWYNTNELKDDKPIADGFRVVHNNVNCMYDFKTLSKDNNSVSDRPLNYFVNMTAHEVLDCINEDYFVKNEDIILHLLKEYI